MEGKKKYKIPVTDPGLLVIVLIVLTLSIWSCDQTFDPIQENNTYYFSIYGYLDASADTQWVRVNPARTQLEVPAVLPEMKVTLKHLQSGKTVVLNDSLFIPGGSPPFVTFWTTTEIEQGQTYLLKAEDPEGRVSRVVTTVPNDFATPRLRREMRDYGEPDSFNLFIDDLEHLADVQTKWYITVTGPDFNRNKIISFSHRNTAKKIYGGGYIIPIEPDQELEKIKNQLFIPTQDGDILVSYKQILVASGGPEWNEEITSLDDLKYTLPNSFSNVENGLGYLVGINSKWLPFESCYNEQILLVGCEEEGPYW